MLIPTITGSAEPGRLRNSTEAALRWAVDTAGWNPCAVQLATLTALLPANEAADVGKFMRHEDRKRALASRLLQRAAVVRVLGIPWEGVRIERTRGRKPFAAHDLPPWAPNFNFNVSHEGDFTVLASEPLAIVGVDVAAPDQLRPRGKTPQRGCKAANTTTNAPIPIIVDTTVASMDITTSIFPTKAPPPLVNPPDLNPSPQTSNPHSTMVCWGPPLAVCPIKAAASQREEDDLLQSMALLKSQFSGQEWEAVLAGTGLGAVHMYATFQRLWSLKEAFIKARGDGLGFQPLSRASFSLQHTHTQQGLTPSPCPGPGLAEVEGPWGEREQQGGGHCRGQAATLMVDGLRQDRWSFVVWDLPRDHVVSVARGPPDVIVDAWGVFRSRLRQPYLDGAALSDALSAPQPVWCIVDVVQLLSEIGILVAGKPIDQMVSST